MEKIALGLMSGTSADGVSLALAGFRKHSFRLLDYKTRPYPPPIRKQILKGAELRANELSRLNIALGIFFAEKVQDFIKKSKISPRKITVIGSHGQTVYHGPDEYPKNTLQIGEPSMIAQKTGLPVVADFRMRDLAAGGEGAPLVPFFDQYFFGGSSVRALQNIGGIANVTVVGPGGPLVAFDTGPGNCLLDWTTQKHSRGRLAFDRDGKIARQGIVNRPALARMMRHPYFTKKPPKSTGRELFNERFLPPELKRDSFANQMATLTYFTAWTIHASYAKFLPRRIREVIVSGGGAFNKTLMEHLSALFRPVPVRNIQDFGIHVQAKEPIAFAFFALQAIENKINHAPKVTGAIRPAILGKIIPGPIS